MWSILSKILMKDTPWLPPSEHVVIGLEFMQTSEAHSIGKICSVIFSSKSNILVTFFASLSLLYFMQYHMMQFILRKLHTNPTLLHLTLIPAWINNYVHYKVWDGITCPFPNFHGCTMEVWGWISNFIPHSITDVITHSCSIWLCFNTTWLCHNTMW